MESTLGIIHSVVLRIIFVLRCCYKYRVNCLRLLQYFVADEVKV